MGLNFSHTKASWSYSGFSSFRKRLAKQLGLGDLEEYVGFGGAKKWPEEFKQDPIYKFINHSDCDGHLTPDECFKIGPRLLILVKDWPADDFDRRQCILLVQGMIQAVFDKTNLEFC